MRLLCRAIALSLVPLAGTAVAARAHPLGNFTVNHLARVTVHGATAQVRYVLDEAEIPAFAVLRALDAEAKPSPAALLAWARDEVRRDGAALRLEADGRPVALHAERVEVETRPGAGGLRTLAVRALLSAALPSDARRIALRDGTYPGRIGWHDVVVGDEREPTGGLRSYPNALLGSPRDRTARVALRVGGDRLRALADAPETAAAAAPSIARTNALANALANAPLSPAAIVAALLLAIALGALHALEPGHGKTLLAVSLAGARATPAQACAVAASLTVAHTAGVFAFGVALLVAARWIVPETIYPWLTIASGAVVAALGARASAHVLAQARGAPHVHAHDAPLTFRGALLAAASGNVAPCPAAIVVLLGAVSLHRVGYGLVLIVAFSFGLALVLTALGLAVVRGAAWLGRRRAYVRLVIFGPAITACVISTIGATLLAQGFAQAGIAAPPLAIGALALAAIAGYAASGTHDHGHARRLPEASR